MNLQEIQSNQIMVAAHTVFFPDEEARTVTTRQWMYLLNAVAGDRELRGAFVGPHGKGRVVEKWRKLAGELNPLGVHKTGAQWQQIVAMLLKIKKNHSKVTVNFYVCFYLFYSFMYLFVYLFIFLFFYLFIYSCIYFTFRPLSICGTARKMRLPLNWPT